MHRCPAAPTGRLIFLLFAECLFPKHLYKYSIGSLLLKITITPKKKRRPVGASIYLCICGKRKGAAVEDDSRPVVLYNAVVLWWTVIIPPSSASPTASGKL